MEWAQVFVPFAINDQGLMAGLSDNDSSFGYESAFRIGTTLTYLPDDATTSVAIDVNNDQQAIVHSWTSDSGQTRSLFYTERGEDAPYLLDLTALVGDDFVAFALNDAGQVVGSDYLYDGSDFHRLTDLIGPQNDWTNLDGLDINNLGQIVGQGVINGKSRAFLMTPMNVPEPNTLLVLGLGIAVTIWCRTRRQYVS